MRAGDRVTFPYTWSSTYDKNGRDTGVMREHTVTVHGTILSVYGDSVAVATEHEMLVVDAAILTIVDEFHGPFDPVKFMMTGDR